MLDISGGQSLVQFGELGLAFGLSALVGLAAAVTALLHRAVRASRGWSAGCRGSASGPRRCG